MNVYAYILSLLVCIVWDGTKTAIKLHCFSFQFISPVSFSTRLSLIFSLFCVFSEF